MPICQTLVTIMKTTLIFIFIILTQTTLWGQDNLWNERGNIIHQYESYSDTSYQYVILDNTDNIAIRIYGSDSLEIEHFIRPYTNGTIDNESLCDSVVINLLCDSCVEFHISRMSNSKERKWIKLSDSIFISSKCVSKFRPADKTATIYTVPMMKIKDNGNLTQIILFTERMTKKKWKEIKSKTVTNSK